MISLIGTFLAGGAFAAIAVVIVELIRKPKTTAEANGLMMGAATDVVQMLREELRTTKEELIEVRAELINTQRIVLHLEHRLTRYERGFSEGHP